MENIQIVIGDKELTFSVRFEDDNDSGAPWANEDGHGPVSGWERRNKRANEMVLNQDRGSYRFYDYAEACKIALRDGWDSYPLNDGSQSKRQQAAKAALADFENLRAWCANEWRYVGVIVTLLDDNGEETNVSESLWGVEDKDDYHHIAAKELADNLAHEYGTQWGEVTKTTYDYLTTGNN